MGLDRTQPPFFPYPNREWTDEVTDAEGIRWPIANAVWLDKSTIQVKVPNELIGHLSCAEVKGYSIDGEDLPTPVPNEAFLREWAANIADDTKEPS